MAMPSKETSEKKSDRSVDEAKIRRLAAIMRDSNDAITLSDLDGRIIAWNRGAELMYGYTEEEALRMTMWQITPAACVRENKEFIRRLMAGEAIVSFETQRSTKDGRTLDIWMTVTKLVDDAGKPIGIGSSDRDISGRIQAEKALREGEEKYRGLVDNANEAILVAQDGLLRFVNRKAGEISGRSMVELMTKPFAHFIHPEDRQMVADNYVNRMKGKSLPLRYEFRLLSVDGSAKWVEISTVVIEWEQRPATLNFLTDITDRKNAEEALRQSEEKYRTLFDGAKDGIALADSATGVIIECNQALCDMVERDKQELLGQSHSVLHPPQEIESGRSFSFAKHKDSDDPGLVTEDRLISKSGKIIPVEICAARIRMKAHDYLMGVFRDCSGRKRLEEEKARLQSQLLQAQKMEAIGVLAGGVAHDFNNLLTAISGYTTLAMGKTDELNPMYRDLKQVGVAAAKAAAIVRQLLLFGRKQHMEPVPMDFNATTSRLIKMLDRLIGEDIAIQTYLEKDLWTILGDEGNIEQVLMNLSVNARDAMPDGGKLFIKTENVTIDREYCRRYNAGRPGRFVCLSIKDTGTGMDEYTQEHIFEPFFTTKDAGKGTGLGLSVVFGIVQQHNGWITVYSEHGLGATFKVYFPSSSARPEEQSHQEPPLASQQGMGERILVVEDNAEVREIAKEMLTINGYAVVPVSSAREARELFEKENGGFDLVFTDMILTDSTGAQLVDGLLSRWKFGVIIASGYTDEKSNWSLIKEKRYRFLNKPYSMQELLAAVKDELAKKEI